MYAAAAYNNDIVWGGLRNMGLAGHIALSVADFPGAKGFLAARYGCFAASQLNYMLGDVGGFSFVVGHGREWSEQPHTREGFCERDKPASWCSAWQWVMGGANPNVRISLLRPVFFCNWSWKVGCQTCELVQRVSVCHGRRQPWCARVGGGCVVNKRTSFICISWRSACWVTSGADLNMCATWSFRLAAIMCCRACTLSLHNSQVPYCSLVHGIRYSNTTTPLLLRRLWRARS